VLALAGVLRALPVARPAPLVLALAVLALAVLALAVLGLDITEPLGLPAPSDDRIALVLESATPRSLKYFGVDLDGMRLVATDADVSMGEGTVHRLPVKQMLLVVTGRRPLTEVPGRAA